MRGKTGGEGKKYLPRGYRGNSEKGKHLGREKEKEVWLQSEIPEHEKRDKQMGKRGMGGYLQKGLSCFGDSACQAEGKDLKRGQKEGVGRREKGVKKKAKPKGPSKRNTLGQKIAPAGLCETYSGLKWWGVGRWSTSSLRAARPTSSQEEGAGGPREGGCRGWVGKRKENQSRELRSREQEKCQNNR